MARPLYPNEKNPAPNRVTKKESMLSKIRKLVIGGKKQWTLTKKV
jgi:hypothetical protein